MKITDILLLILIFFLGCETGEEEMEEEANDKHSEKGDGATSFLWPILLVSLLVLSLFTLEVVLNLKL